MSRGGVAYEAKLYTYERIMKAAETDEAVRQAMAVVNDVESFTFTNEEGEEVPDYSQMIDYVGDARDAGVGQEYLDAVATLDRVMRTITVKVESDDTPARTIRPLDRKEPA